MKVSKYEQMYQNSERSDYLHAKRMEIYQKMGFEKNNNPDFDMSILDYMKTNYPNEEELISLEELRVSENQQIFEEWQQSNDPRSFTEYAQQEYGFYDSDDLSETMSSNRGR